MHKAYLHRNFKIAAYLETCGADTLIKNKHGKTPAEVGQDYADTRGVLGSKYYIFLCILLFFDLNIQI